MYDNKVLKTQIAMEAHATSEMQVVDWERSTGNNLSDLSQYVGIERSWILMQVAAVLDLTYLSRDVPATEVVYTLGLAIGTALFETVVELRTVDTYKLLKLAQDELNKLE